MFDAAGYGKFYDFTLLDGHPWAGHALLESPAPSDKVVPYAFPLLLLGTPFADRNGCTEVRLNSTP